MKWLNNITIENVKDKFKEFGININNEDGSYKTIDVVFNEIKDKLNKK